MPKFIVFHRKEPDFRPQYAPPFEENYKHVADVDAPDIHDVFRLTNHIDESWTTNEGVTAVSDRQRSTSVGDIVQQGDKYYLCDRFGWKLIEELS